jgi:glycosyltransferase involved in cell wall biosynthesis
VVNAFGGLGHVFVTEDWKHRAMRRIIGVAYRLVLRHPHMKVIFQNNDDRLFFVRSGWLREEQTVLIAGSGVDPEQYRPAGRDDPVNGIPVVMFPSRMLRSKGVEEFLEAVARLRSQKVRARFVLVGEPDPDNPASISEHELSGRVHEAEVEYWGRRDDMPAVFAAADIVCLPSHREGMPKALIEAAAAGLPIVTTDVPGCRDVVRHEHNGLLVPLRDANALSIALRRLIENPQLGRRMGQRGRARVLEEFSLDRVIASTLALYRDLLA